MAASNATEGSAPENIFVVPSGPIMKKWGVPATSFEMATSVL